MIYIFEDWVPSPSRASIMILCRGEYIVVSQCAILPKRMCMKAVVVYYKELNCGISHG